MNHEDLINNWARMDRPTYEGEWMAELAQWRQRAEAAEAALAKYEALLSVKVSYELIDAMIETRAATLGDALRQLEAQQEAQP